MANDDAVMANDDAMMANDDAMKPRHSSNSTIECHNNLH